MKSKQNKNYPINIMSDQSEFSSVAVGILWHLKRAGQQQTGSIYFLAPTAVLADPSGYTATNFKRM